MGDTFNGTGLTYHLTVRQQPMAAKRFIQTQKKEPRPIDPFPVVQVSVLNSHSHSIPFDSNPAFVMSVSLVHPRAPTEEAVGVLSGNMCSSMHRLKDLDGSLGGYFVFPDLYASREGSYRLRFTLYEMEGLDSPEMMDNTIIQRAFVLSNVFQVYSAKSFPGMSESTALSRLFADQGLKIRVRKETRASNYKKRMREMEGPNELTPTAYRQSSPVDKRQALEHGHGQAHSAPPPGAYYSHHQSLSPSGVRPPPLPHPLYSYYPGPPPGYHLTPDSRYPPGAYGPPHHSHANYHPGYWSQYPVSSPPPGAQHLPGQYPHVPVPAPSERIPSAGQYSSQPPHVSPGQYPPGQSYYPPPHHGLPMHHQSGPPAHLSAHSQYPGMHHPSQGHSAQHHPGQSPRFPSLPSPTLRPNSVSLTHSMARLDPDFRQKSPERTMGPSPGSTEQSPITEHGKYPQTTLPPVSLLPNFESARQSPIDGAVPGEGGIVPPYLDSPPARENLSCLVGSPDK